jgi:hypothetical protein
VTFEPESEQSLRERSIWPKGDYDFEIIEVFEKVSQSRGNPMFELIVKITRPEGSRIITDYVLPKRPEKLRQCCGACGVLDKYDQGVLAADDFVGKRGRLKLGVEKDKARKYPDKNVVVDYVFASGLAKLGLSLRK